MPLKLNQDELPTINLTSLIDILFLLIIFFMVGTKFSETESSISINMPKVGPNGAMLQRPSNKTVTVAADGSIQFEGQRVSPDQLTGLLIQAKQNYPDTCVQIKADAAATTGMLSAPINAIRQSGVKVELAFASSPLPNARR